MNQEIFETYFPGLIVKEEDREKCENYLKLKGIELLKSEISKFRASLNITDFSIKKKKLLEIFNTSVDNKEKII